MSAESIAHLFCKRLNETEKSAGDFMSQPYFVWPAVAVLAGLAGCASSSDTVTGSYISPLQYQSYSCQQLGEEAQRISARVSQSSGVQDQKRTNDALVTTAAVIIFWPAAFFVSGNDQNTAELSRLKGESEALEKASIQKSCGIQFQRQPAPPTKPVESGMPKV